MGLTPFKPAFSRKQSSLYMWPTTQVKKLVYAEAISLDPSAAGAIAAYVFRVNQMYDPNVSGTGHQPQGYDTLAAAYGRYNVLSAKIFIDAGPNTAPTTTYVTGIAVRDYNSTSTLFGAGGYYTHIIEHGSTNWKHYANDLSQKVKLSYACNPMKFNNSSMTQNEVAFGNNFPTDPVYFYWWMQNAGGGSQDLPAFYGTVRIEYLVRVMDPIEQADN